MSRDREIEQALQNKLVQDTIILQKVNMSNRIAFVEKYPGLIEHTLRLLVERLQNGLDKRDNVDLNDVHTWKLQPNELVDLSTAVYYIHKVREDLIANQRHIDE